MREDLELRGLRPITIEKYLQCAGEHARYFSRAPGQLGPEDIRQFVQRFVVPDGSFLNRRRIESGRFGIVPIDCTVPSFSATATAIVSACTSSPTHRVVFFMTGSFRM